MNSHCERCCPCLRGGERCRPQGTIRVTERWFCPECAEIALDEQALALLRERLPEGLRPPDPLVDPVADANNWLADVAHDHGPAVREKAERVLEASRAVVGEGRDACDLESAMAEFVRSIAGRA